MQKHKNAIEALRDLSRQSMGAIPVPYCRPAGAGRGRCAWRALEEFAAEAGKAKDETVAVLRMDLANRQKYESGAG